jgi:hypothetical protein
MDKDNIVKEGYIVQNYFSDEYYDENDCTCDEIQEACIYDNLDKLLNKIEDWDEPEYLQICKVKITYEVVEKLRRKISYEPTTK